MRPSCYREITWVVSYFPLSWRLVDQDQGVNVMRASSWQPCFLSMAERWTCQWDNGSADDKDGAGGDADGEVELGMMEMVQIWMETGIEMVGTSWCKNS